MPTQQRAHIHGTVGVEPWRVGVLVDSASMASVLGGIKALTPVWGGRYMPLLDSNMPIPRLRELARSLAIDSLWSMEPVEEGTPLAELLSEQGLRWGYGPGWGPFTSSRGDQYKSLLNATSMPDASGGMQFGWDDNDDRSSLLSAYFGSPVADSSGRDRSWLPWDLLGTEAHEMGDQIGPLHYNSPLIEVERRIYLERLAGVFVIDPTSPQQVIDFWNIRSCGVRLIPIAASGLDDLRTAFLRAQLPTVAPAEDESAPSQLATVRVFGYANAHSDVQRDIATAITRQGSEMEIADYPHWPAYDFPGLRSTVSRSFRAEFEPRARWVELELPNFPLNREADLLRGTAVAVHISISATGGLDPRLGHIIPAYRRHAKLVNESAAGVGIDQGRTFAEGVRLRLSAREDYVRYPLIPVIDSINVLIDNESVDLAQSELGIFQTQAAQRLGGPFSGQLNQPGLRALLQEAARSRTGLPLQRLLSLVRNNKGAWPDRIFGPKITDQKYASDVVNYLMHQGILIATMRVQCSTCRVEQYVSADALASTMICEFCGNDFNLALSTSLTPPSWNYRLAAHLRPDQVQSMIPALATTSTISQISHYFGPPPLSIYGLELSRDGRKMEMDLVAYIPTDGTVILGEVKTANLIDQNDIDNVLEAQSLFLDAGAPTVCVFATMKDRWAPQELRLLRSFGKRRSWVNMHRGDVRPNFPLVFTGPDLSFPYFHDDHPWHWDKGSPRAGLFGTAESSCRKHLGLSTYTVGADGELQAVWDDDLLPQAAHEPGS